MELAEVLRSRRMVRRFDAGRPVPAEAARCCLRAALRAPSAGFSQGWDFVVLRTAAERERFWAATRSGEPDAWSGEPDAWLTGVSAAPVLVVCCSDPQAYFDRYAEPDKGWTDRDPARWPVPYWDVDTGMAAELILLAAVDQGLGALFFGVPSDRHVPVRSALRIPPDRRLVGVVALGYAAPGPRSAGRRRARRGVEEVVHWGAFGVRQSPQG